MGWSFSIQSSVSIMVQEYRTSAQTKSNYRAVLIRKCTVNWCLCLRSYFQRWLHRYNVWYFLFRYHTDWWLEWLLWLGHIKRWRQLLHDYEQGSFTRNWNISVEAIWFQKADHRLLNELGHSEFNGLRNLEVILDYKSWNTSRLDWISFPRKRQSKAIQWWNTQVWGFGNSG